MKRVDKSTDFWGNDKTVYGAGKIWYNDVIIIFQWKVNSVAKTGRMKKRLFKWFLIILIILAGVSGTVLIIFSNTFSDYQGKVPGTGFVREETLGTATYYDVDNEGNIYLAIDSAISIYNNTGKYLYTLPVSMLGGKIAIRIDENDNITVYDARGNAINVYNQTGVLINTIYDTDNKYYSTFFNFDPIKKPDGRIYSFDGNTLTQTVNGETKIIYKTPLYQELYNVFYATLLLSSVTIFLMNFFKYLPRHIQNLEQKRLGHKQ